MISFKQFLAEEETLLNEVFAGAPFAERDSDAEAFAQKMVPPNTIHDVHVHKVEGMLSKHRIMSFTNNNGEREHHIMTMDNTHGRLGHDDISPSNSLAAYGHIVHKTKESIDKGQSTRFQVRDSRQYNMYHKTVSRMIDRSGKNATIHELGKQTSAQGFKIPTFVVEPN